MGAGLVRVQSHRRSSDFAFPVVGAWTLSPLSAHSASFHPGLRYFYPFFPHKLLRSFDIKKSTIN